MPEVCLLGNIRLRGELFSFFIFRIFGTNEIDSCGDYASGTNHTLPTNGFARQYSGVNTQSFQKHITSQEITPEGLKALGPVVVTLADCEGLTAHGNAVRVRLSALAA